MSDPLSAQRPAFILASGSPRRVELTRQLGLEPLVHKSDVPEAPEPGESALQYTRRLAAQKAAHVAQQLAHRDELPAWVLSADTVVVLDGQILEKPRDAAHARQMLRALSGRAHEVITAFCWRSRLEPERAQTHHVITQVYFKALDEDTIARYVATGEPMDKAGAYGIQGLGGALIARVEGSYTCVVGLPVAEVIDALRELGGISAFPLVSAQALARSLDPQDDLAASVASTPQEAP